MAGSGNLHKVLPAKNQEKQVSSTLNSKTRLEKLRIKATMRLSQNAD